MVFSSMSEICVDQPMNFDMKVSFISELHAAKQLNSILGLATNILTICLPLQQGRSFRPPLILVSNKKCLP